MANLLRVRTGAQRVTNVELFFDLVYVFAVTQLSHYLLGHATVEGAFQTALLLALVWLAWEYTAWTTNYLDPDRIPVRLLLMSLMLVSLVMSAALPQAFGKLGLVVGAAYATMQIGRSAFMMVALRGERLERTFQRLLVWSVVSGGLAILGGMANGHARELLWLLAPGTDLLGAAVGFYTPGLGRSVTTDWTIAGSHLAERCQGFILIALGESIVVIGATLAGLPALTAPEVLAFMAAFSGAVGLWWLYFDRGADESERVIAASTDPGRLGRSAFHFIHPIMVAGIIVTAAADELVLSHPARIAEASTVWLVLGGTALFLAGHAAFKIVVWRHVSWTRLGAVAVLAALGLFGKQLTGVALISFAAVGVIAVALSDRLLMGHDS